MLTWHNDFSYKLSLPDREKHREERRGSDKGHRKKGSFFFGVKKKDEVNKFQKNNP